MILFEGTSVGSAEVREVISIEPLAGLEEEAESEPETLREMVEAFEARLLARELEATGGVVARVAERLKTDRANLYRKLKRYGLR
jgi:DNA-binding NtrC family response regulator